MVNRPRPRLSVLVLAPLVSSLAPGSLWVVPGAAPDDPSSLRVLIAVLGTLPALGAGAAFVHAGARGTSVVRPLIPYAVLAIVFAAASWFPVLLSGNPDALFTCYLYAIPALPVLALVGSYAVLYRTGSAPT